MADDRRSIRRELERVEVALNSLRQALSGPALDQASAPLLKRKAELEAELRGSGAIAQGDRNVAAGEGATVIQESIVINAEKGARVVIGTEPVKMSRKLRETALGRYLEHVIAHNRYLHLQGIRSGGKLVNIELEQIYITLRTTGQRTAEAHEEWLTAEASMAPGEMGRVRLERGPATETLSVAVDQALASHRHLVVLGDPGSGKTTLMRYLALLYARDLAEGTDAVRTKLTLDEKGYLPVLLPLRQIGQFLKAHRPQNDGTEGHALLLEFLNQSLRNQRIELPSDFFDPYLTKGQAVILLDGMDEVADPALRARVARLIEAFTLARPGCRFVVTSRIVGYTGASRLGGDYVTTTVQDFTVADVEQFLRHWHRLVAVGQMGPGDDAEEYAATQTAQLMQAVRSNERIRELAINPLMLTVIALVHRDRVKLPDRRAELYAEAVDVLLGKWDEARGITDMAILDNRPFDAGDKRLILQAIALHMHEAQKKEISTDEFQRLLRKAFAGMLTDENRLRIVIERFQRVIEERTGLLAARGEGVFSFSHLTFQEYMAALAVAARDDYVEYSLERASDSWWREAILLEAGHLGMLSKERTTRLIRAIADKRREPQPYHNLVLAAECLRDVGDNRVDPSLQTDVRSRMNEGLRAPVPLTARWFGRIGLRGWVERRADLLQALARMGTGFWKPPYGEPEWITIRAGPFWMGEGNEMHRVDLPAFQIARVPITNAQYALFVQDAQYEAPHDWVENRPPRGHESHPVAFVRWYDAIAYSRWLSQKTGKDVTLPSEAEWEKAARSDEKREYPWGSWESYRANTWELGIGTTTPAGIFLEGASPYGVMDLSGNVWEWTRSLWGSNESKPSFNYPYDPTDRQRESLNARRNILRVLRGGSFIVEANLARSAHRVRLPPDSRSRVYGFRVVVSPILPSRI